jgi:aryl-alcohol dehydrogenase-like predicted oxidoreductase
MTTFLPTTQLGWTGMHLTRVGFGAWAIGGGDWAYAWGNQDDTASVAAIRYAVESGINWIDTAAVYGLGHSEEVVAWTLAFPGVTGAIVGARSPGQVDGWLPAASLELKDDDLSDIAAAIRATGAGTGPASPPVAIS